MLLWHTANAVLEHISFRTGRLIDLKSKSDFFFFSLDDIKEKENYPICLKAAVFVWSPVALNSIKQNVFKLVFFRKK